MKLKLVIDGEDRRVRIASEDKFDEKLMDMITEAKSAKLVKSFEMYTRELDHVDLVLDFEDPSYVDLGTFTAFEDIKCGDAVVLDREERTVLKARQ